MRARDQDRDTSRSLRDFTRNAPSVLPRPPFPNPLPIYDVVQSRLVPIMPCYFPVWSVRLLNTKNMHVWEVNSATACASIWSRGGPRVNQKKWRGRPVKWRVSVCKLSEVEGVISVKWRGYTFEVEGIRIWSGGGTGYASRNGGAAPRADFRAAHKVSAWY